MPIGVLLRRAHLLPRERPAEQTSAQRTSALREQERPRDECEEERVGLGRREDERERIEGDEKQRVYGAGWPEERARDPDERDGRGGRGDKRDQDARDDRRARHPRHDVH